MNPAITSISPLSRSISSCTYSTVLPGRYYNLQAKSMIHKVKDSKPFYLTLCVSLESTGWIILEAMPSPHSRATNERTFLKMSNWYVKNRMLNFAKTRDFFLLRSDRFAHSICRLFQRSLWSFRLRSITKPLCTQLLQAQKVNCLIVLFEKNKNTRLQSLDDRCHDTWY